MPNHWMDQIVKLYEDYYNDKITQLQLVNKVEQVMVDYKKEYEIFDEAITDQMVEMEGYVQD